MKEISGLEYSEEKKINTEVYNFRIPYCQKGILMVLDTSAAQHSAYNEGKILACKCLHIKKWSMYNKFIRN